MSGLGKLREHWPLPTEMPDVPRDRHPTRDEPTGWCAGENRKLFAKVCNDNTRVVIDGGSFLGLSAWFLLKLAPNATIICIDHWKGSAEHQTRRDLVAKLPLLYETFIRNLWDCRDRIIPVRADSVVGMQEIHALDIHPDVVYVDWSHDADSVHRDLTTALDLFPEAVIIGDDWTWQSVREGIFKTLLPHKMYDLHTYQTCYRITRK